MPRGVSLAACILLVPLGLGTKRYHGLGDAWVHANAGDILYAAFWFFVALLVWPRASLWKAGAAVFLYCTTVEFSQLLHTPWLDGLRRTLPGRLLLGSEFDWSDIGCYAVGIVVAAGLSALFRQGVVSGEKRSGQ